MIITLIVLLNLSVSGSLFWYFNTQIVKNQEIISILEYRLQEEISGRSNHQKTLFDELGAIKMILGEQQDVISSITSTFQLPPNPTDGSTKNY